MNHIREDTSGTVAKFLIFVGYDDCATSSKIMPKLDFLATVPGYQLKSIKAILGLNHSNNHAL